LVTCRLTLKITAWASNGVPSWNVTPGRSFITHVVPSSGVVMDSARKGCGLPWASILSRES
jgi:hypothetical protein